MAALSDHAENLLLNWLMTTGTAARPTQWFVALFSSAPNDAGGGTEINGNGYSRQSVSWDTASGTGGTTANSGVVSFTASGSGFGTVTHIGIFDASSAGNLLWHGGMDTAKSVAAGDVLQFAVGAIDLTIA